MQLQKFISSQLCINCVTITADYCYGNVAKH